MALYMQALIEFRKTNYTAAREEVLKVLKVAPNHMPSTLLAGAVEYALGSGDRGPSRPRAERRNGRGVGPGFLEDRAERRPLCAREGWVREGRVRGEVHPFRAGAARAGARGGGRRIARKPPSRREDWRKGGADRRVRG